ncbi:MAG: hypothetical protein K2N03_00505, partial [Muribaculaceae bacterium]|nr:hypothetical protein [Muribaculaceae bacterium]
KKTIYQLWDTKNWCELMSLNTSDMAFFNHKLQIAYIKDNEIIICDYSGNILSRWPITDSQLVYSLTLSPDDKELLVCTSDTLSLWDIKNQRKTYVYSGERLNGAKFSSDGNYIVTHSEWGNVNFFDVSELQEKPTHIIQYNASVEDAMFSPQLSSFAEFNYAEGIVRLYRNPMNQRREQLFEHIYHTNNDIYLSTNENHIITVDNDYVILEDIAQGTKEMIKNPFAERKISSSGNTYYLNMINEIHYSPKMGYWAIIAKSDKKVHVYTRNMEKELLVIPTDAQIFTLSFSKDSKYLAIGCRDKNVYIWDLHANQCYAKFTGHQNGVTSVSFSDDNKYVISGSFDNTIRVWSMKERKEILDKRDATEYDLNSVALSPDNKYYIYADKHLVHIKDFSTKKEIYSLNITDAQTVFFSQDGKHIYMLRGDYNLDDYDGNHIVRLPFPSFDDIYDFFTPFFLKYSLSEEEKIKYFMK